MRIVIFSHIVSKSLVSSTHIPSTWTSLSSKFTTSGGIIWDKLLSLALASSLSPSLSTLIAVSSLAPYSWMQIATKTRLQSTSSEFMGGNDMQTSWSKLENSSAAMSPSICYSSDNPSKRLLSSSSTSSASSMLRGCSTTAQFANQFLMVYLATSFHTLFIHSMVWTTLISFAIS